MGILDSAKEKFEKVIFNKEKETESEKSGETQAESENEQKSDNVIMENLKKEKNIILDLPMYEGKWQSQSNIKKSESSFVLDIMRSIPMFNGIRERELKKLIPLFYTRHFAANEYLFRQGNPGSCMFIIKRGQVNIQTVSERNDKGKTIEKETIIYAKLIDGAMFGEMSLINKSSRSTDALCTTDTDVFVLFRYDLEDLFKKEPELGFTLYTRINEITFQRMADTNSKLVVAKLENNKLSAYIDHIYKMQNENPDAKIRLYTKDEVMNKTTFNDR